jgi:hypothetical protein
LGLIINLKFLTFIKYFKLYALVGLTFLFILINSQYSHAAEQVIIQNNSSLSSTNHIRLIDTSTNPNGLAVPNSFLGIHLNRWKDNSSTDFDISDYHSGYSQVSAAVVANVNGLAILTLPKGHGFYNYRKGVTIRLLGMGLGGKDFEAYVVSGTLGAAGASATTQYIQLSAMPAKLGVCTIQYRPYIPTFSYGAVRSHGSKVKWSTLHLGPGLYNTKLMNDWVNRHHGKKLMFTMTDTPEWLATSNVTALTRSVLNNIVTIKHTKSVIGSIPVGTLIKVRNSSNPKLNGAFKVIESTSTTTIYLASNLANEETTVDKNTEILIWGNNAGFGINNPPKDMEEVNNFITWLVTNYGNKIEWIEGQNEANSSYLWDGTLKQNQGSGSWWMGSLAQLADMQKRIYLAAKAIKPSIHIGSPALTGLTPDQPINRSLNNQSSTYRLLTASDGSGGKLSDWIDFVPFHVYDLGTNGEFNQKNKRSILDLLIYIKQTLNEKAINKPNIPIYMNEGGFEHYGNYESPVYNYFNSLTKQQQANEIFKQAAIYAGYGVKGFYPWVSGFMGDYETTPEIAAVYDKVNKRIAGKTISPDAWFNKASGEMFFKTTDGFEEHIP